MEKLSQYVAELSNYINNYEKRHDINTLIHSSSKTINDFKILLGNVKTKSLSHQEVSRLSNIIREYEHHTKIINEIISRNKFSAPHLAIIGYDEELDERESLIKAARDQHSKILEEDAKKRHQELQKLESDMLAIHEIMIDLNNLLNVQGETLNNIEANITSAEYNVEQGVNELDKAKNMENSNRKCMLVGILIIIVLILIIVLPLVLRN